MKFVCMGYYELEKFEKMPQSEMTAIEKKCKVHDAELRATGKMRLVASLSMPKDWKSIRPGKGGKPVVTDGPFSETKELIGSFFIVEAADITEAVELASKHPAALMGAEMGWGVDVRACEYYEEA
jgi:hypothetical protein